MIDNKTILNNLTRLTNQIYKLLPNREEGEDWQKPLETIIEEISGMRRLMEEHQETIFILLCKLEGLFTLTNRGDYFLFRRTIFDILGIVNDLYRECQR